MSNISSVESYDNKSKLYDNYRKEAPGWNEINNILENFLMNNSNCSILDVGCGTGVFMEKLSKYDYKELHGIDPSKEMIKKCQERMNNIDCFKMDNENNKIWVDTVENIDDDRYDIVICSQVIQNLTLDQDKSLETRYKFYFQLHRILKKGGQLILTTRNSESGYENLYWYCDKNIMPKSIEQMSNFVPKNLEGELYSTQIFKNIKLFKTTDLIYEDIHYTNIDLLNNEAWYAADSFWSHVVRNNELDNFKCNIQRLKENNTILGYIIDRDKLRQNKGHIAILHCYK